MLPKIFTRFPSEVNSALVGVGERTFSASVEKLRDGEDTVQFSHRVLTEFPRETMAEDLDMFKAELCVWSEGLEDHVLPMQLNDLRVPLAESFAGGLVMGAYLIGLAIRFSEYPRTRNFNIHLTLDKPDEWQHIQSGFNRFQIIQGVVSEVAEGRMAITDSDLEVLQRCGKLERRQFNELFVSPLDAGELALPQNARKLLDLVHPCVDFGLDAGVTKTVGLWIRSLPR